MRKAGGKLKEKKIPDAFDFENISVECGLDENLRNIKNILGNTSDLLISPITICGVRAAVVCFEGMVSGLSTAHMVVRPLMGISIPECTGEKLFAHIRDNMILSVDTAVKDRYGDIIRMLMSGFAAVFVDTQPRAICCGIQGYDKRGVEEPSSEGNIRGSHEGFVETVRTNMSLVRRRMKTPLLRFELFPISPRSNTDVIVCYMSDRVPAAMVRSIKKKLKNIELETILGSGYVEPFLAGRKPSVFSGLSITERPDVMCAKLLEGVWVL